MRISVCAKMTKVKSKEVDRKRSDRSIGVSYCGEEKGTEVWSPILDKVEEQNL